MRRTAPVLHWKFLRGGDQVSCVLDLDRRSGQFGVAVVDLKRTSRAPVETFDRLDGALIGHAALASQLLDAGWKRVVPTA